jgi:hypothetical protein
MTIVLGRLSMPTFVAPAEVAITHAEALELSGDARPESRLLLARSHGAQPPPDR